MFAIAVVLKAAAVLALAGIGATAARRSSASTRHLIWTAAVIAALVIPLFEVLVPAWAPVQVPAVVAGTVLMDAAGNTEPLPVERSADIAWSALLMSLWITGATVVLVRIAVGTLRLRIAAGRSRIRPPEWVLQTAADVRRQFGISRLVTVSGTTKVTMPLTYGVVRPQVLLPASAAGWKPERLRAVLLHEFMHVKRYDWLTQTAAQAACALYWFNPLVWLAAARMRVEREHACDDAVLTSGVRASDYAEHLVFIARSISQSNEILSASAAMAQPSLLEGRIRAVLNTSLTRTFVTRQRALFAAVGLLALLLPIAAVRSVAQTSSASGTISGVVRDPSGAVVPHAVVTAVNTEKGNRELTSTNQVGEYEFRSIPAGHYTVEVRSAGFAKWISKEMDLGQGTALRANAVLQVGMVAEDIEVVAQSPAAQSKNNGPTRIPVGGNVQATKILKMIRPAYPDRAKAAGVEGPVIMKAVIGTEGDLLSLEVMNTLADPELATAAKEAVSQWKYTPTLLNGKPVEVITTITVNFKLAPQ